MTAGIRKLLVATTAIQLTIVGCTTPHRLPAVPSPQAAQAVPLAGNVRFLVTRETDSFEAEARASLAREQQWLAKQEWKGPLPPAQFLAISGGGDNGAYAAGFLNGWTAAGTRPQFKAVTGISTGALIAPFAFLGPKYDYVLERVYTTTAPKDIFKKRGLIKGVFGDAMADSRPLAKVIAAYVTPELLQEIAAEYAKGRILLVGTTNLDSLEPVIWNMTAIAASPDPSAITLFEKVLLASASIPGAFPPVMINVNANGSAYEEMHVDGGTMAQLFLYPPSVSLASAPSRARSLYIIRNARLDADWASVERRTLNIIARAVTSLTTTQGVGDLYRVYAAAQRDGIDFNLTFIPPSFNETRTEQFDTRYMKALYDVAFAAAKSSPPWQKAPPGFQVPARTSQAVEGK